jgi:uncharacterized membrane protein
MNINLPTHSVAAARMRRAVVFLDLALVALLFAWHLIPTPSAGTAVLALVLCMPLLLPLPGLLRGRRYTYRWTTLCVLPYLIIGTTEVIANPLRRAWSGTMLLLALLLFAALLGFLRTGSDLDAKDQMPSDQPNDPATRAQTVE